MRSRIARQLAGVIRRGSAPITGCLMAAAFVAPAASAQESTFGAAACVLTDGVSGHLNPVVGTPGGILGDLGNDITNLQLDTDSGSFDFSGTATCAGVDISGNPALGLPAEYDIDAGGEFDNLYCGTGTANGTANISGPGPTSINSNFGLTFVAGAGALTLEVSNRNGSAGTAFGQPITGGNGAGVINIAPNGATATSNNCVNSGVGSFDVHGAFSSTLTG